MRSTKDRFREFAKWFGTFAVVNFLAFWVVAVAIGGDALNGKVENGRYYLMSHGRYTERSFAVWTYSRWHAISVFVTWPLAILVGAAASTGARPNTPADAAFAAYRAKLRDELMP
jgi:hypothetical protein